MDYQIAKERLLEARSQARASCKEYTLRNQISRISVSESPSPKKILFIPFLQPDGYGDFQNTLLYLRMIHAWGHAPTLLLCWSQERAFQINETGIGGFEDILFLFRIKPLAKDKGLLDQLPDPLLPGDVRELPSTFACPSWSALTGGLSIRLSATAERMLKYLTQFLSDVQALEIPILVMSQWEEDTPTSIQGLGFDGYIYFNAVDDMAEPNILIEEMHLGAPYCNSLASGFPLTDGYLFSELKFTVTPNMVSQYIGLHRPNATIAYLRTADTDRESDDLRRFLLSLVGAYMVTVGQCEAPVIFHNVEGLPSTLALPHYKTEVTLMKYAPMSRDAFLTAVELVSDETPVLMTGDNSFMEALLLGKLVIYDLPSHKEIDIDAYLPDGVVIPRVKESFTQLVNILSQYSVRAARDFINSEETLLALKGFLEYQRGMVDEIRQVTSVQNELAKAIQTRF